MFFLIFILCLVTAIVFFILINKFGLKKLPVVLRVIFTIITFFLFFGSSIFFFGITAARIGLKNLVDSGATYVEEKIYVTFPDNSLVQDGFDLSFIFEYQEICIALAHMLDSDDGMIDGVSSLLFSENSFVGPLVMNNIVRPIYPAIKDYILEYASREYPDIYNTLWNFYVDVFNVLIYQIEAIDAINNVLVEQFSGEYIITVSMVIEMIKTPIKAYITSVAAGYQYAILLINGIYFAVFIVIGTLVEKRRLSKIASKEKALLSNKVETTSPDSAQISEEKVSEEEVKEAEKAAEEENEEENEISKSDLSEYEGIEDIIRNEMPVDKATFIDKDIPEDKATIAKESYLKLKQGEKLLWLHDSTIFGGAKEGICLTDMGIYWKCIDKDNGRYVQYKDIREMEVKVKLFNKYLFINGEQLEMCPHSDELMKVINKIKEKIQE